MDPDRLQKMTESSVAAESVTTFQLLIDYRKLSGV